MDMTAAFPPHLTEQQCIVQASTYYKANPLLVQAVRVTENGRAGKVSKNTDGSVDIAEMQINSVHLPSLAKFGITMDMLLRDTCLNIHIGTYLLQREINRATDFWTGVGNYHSKTPSKNQAYQYRVWGNLQKLQHQYAQQLQTAQYAQQYQFGGAQ